MNIQKISIRVLVVAICALLMFGAAFGQTKKKKKHTARKPVAVKPAQTGDAAIVSRADQYQDTSNQIIQPATPSLADTQGLPDDTAKRIKDLQARIKKLENTQASDKKSTYEQRQQILLTNLDILTKSEQRAESLRKQRFEMIDKESSIRTRLDQIEVDIRPESIERSVATVGSLRPEELREAKRKSLEAEQKNLQNLLNDVVTARTRIEADILRSDALTEKLRTRLEKDIDDALDSDQPDQ